jgi:hypothetical protein
MTDQGGVNGGVLPPETVEGMNLLMRVPGG